MPWLNVVQAPKLDAGAVQLWWAAPADAAPWMHELLDADERGRLAKLHFPADQGRFLVGSTMLKHAAAAALGRTPETIRLVRRCPDCDQPHGKPTVPGTGVELSLAHSGERVVVAVALGTPVGVDVEQETPSLDPDALAGAVLTAREADALAALPADQRRFGFLTYWTRKEAALKATGDGLRVPLHDVEVTGPAEPPRVLAFPDRPPSSLSLLGLDAGHGHIGALAVLGPMPSHVLDLKFG